MLENALFVNAFGYMVELTVKGWHIIAMHSSINKCISCFMAMVKITGKKQN